MYFKNILYIVKSQLCIVELWFLVVTSRSYDAHCRLQSTNFTHFQLPFRGIVLAPCLLFRTFKRKGSSFSEHGVPQTAASF